MNKESSITELGGGDRVIAAQPAPSGGTGRSRVTLLTFAVTCGVSVANIYYAQPLLDAIAKSFAIDPATVGLVVTLTQVGYAAGLLCIVPLGDLVDRRKLVIGQTLLSCAALVVAGTAPTAPIFLGGMMAVGLLAVVVQVLVAFTAALAAPAERGRAVGLVTSGVITGILAARFASGVLADLGGWRAVYLCSAALMLVLSALLARIMPKRERPSATKNYLAALKSVPALFLREPLPRSRAILALLTFASFSTLWTSLVLPLSAPPLSLTHTEIGLFGFAGLAGALAATGAGRLADRGFGQLTTGTALALLTLSWIPISFLPHSLALLAAGVVLLDLAVQAVHVTNQSLILAAYPDAQSRLVGGYMVFYSIGSAVGAIASTSIYAVFGWIGVSVLGAAFSASGFAVWALTRRAACPERTGHSSSAA